MKTATLEFLFDAMYHGKYDFQDFLHSSVLESCARIRINGKPAYHPNKKLGAYHSFINTFLCGYLDVNCRVVYSYRKGVNPNEAVIAHASSRAFFQTDIVNFFGSIGRDLVRATIMQRGGRVPISDLHLHVERLLELTTMEGVLPVGFSTSPLISNSCLTGFDDDLEARCLSAGLVYTRYADDIIISAQDRDQLNDIARTINDLLLCHFSGKLVLNQGKSKLTSVGRKVKVLGMVILPSGRVTIDNDLKKRIEVLLHFYTKSRQKFLDAVQHDMKSGVEQLSGYVNYVNTADKPYLEKLKRKFGATVVDSFLHKSAK